MTSAEVHVDELRLTAFSETSIVQRKRLSINAASTSELIRGLTMDKRLYLVSLEVTNLRVFVEHCWKVGRMLEIKDKTQD